MVLLVQVSPRVVAGPTEVLHVAAFAAVTAAERFAESC